MQAIMEPIFHFSYLTTVIFVGMVMFFKSKDNHILSGLVL